MALLLAPAPSGEVAGRRGVLRRFILGWSTPRRLTTITAGVLVLTVIGGLTIAGTWPRLAEYR